MSSDQTKWKVGPFFGVSEKERPGLVFGFDSFEAIGEQLNMNSFCVFLFSEEFSHLLRASSGPPGRCQTLLQLLV